MDHHAVLARLSVEEKAKLSKRSDRQGLRHLAVYLVFLLCGSAWIGIGLPLWGVGLVVQGILIVFLFTLCHECTHQTPFKTVWVNEWVGYASGFHLLLPFQWFRYFHLAHHRYTNDPERDPELASAKPESWGDYLWHVSGIPYWRSMISVVIRNAFGQPEGDFLPERAMPRVRREARVMVGLYVLAATSLLYSPLLFWLWILPALVGQPFLRLYLLAEHGHCLPVTNMLENTRTTFTNRIIRFLAWNMPYHIEHHSFPSVPFHALPALHAHMRDDLITTSPGYGAFTREYTGGL